MKQEFKYIILFIAFLSSIACQDIIELPLEQERERLVIDGLILDKEGQSTVKLYTTLNYYDSAKLPPVSDASVRLLDGNRNLVQAFDYDPSDSTYKCDANFTAEIGFTYILEVSALGDIYEAKGEIIENGQLDTLYYLSKEELEDLGKNVFDGEYFIFADGRINPDTIKFFQLRVTVNDTLRDSRGDIANSILSSRFFESEFDSLQIPGDFNGQDSVVISLYSLNADGFQFYNEFTNLLFNDGGIFSPPPVNPTNNIINVNNPLNYALGFVQYSSMLRKEIFIDEEYEP